MCYVYVTIWSIDVLLENWYDWSLFVCSFFTLWNLALSCFSRYLMLYELCSHYKKIFCFLIDFLLKPSKERCIWPGVANMIFPCQENKVDCCATSSMRGVPMRQNIIGSMPSDSLKIEKGRFCKIKRFSVGRGLARIPHTVVGNQEIVGNFFFSFL